MRREHRKLSPRGVALAALLGTTIEWYDFYVYSTSVALILAPLFFPASDPLTSSLLAFSSLGVGFLARPLGGIVFAHFGDRIGRKNTLIVSLIMMGIATMLVGMLPTYAEVGYLAPVLLVVLRFVQGLAVGGEWGGAVLLAVEQAPPSRRAFYGSFPQYGSPLGLLLSSAVIALFQLLPGNAFMEWGWRVPFLLSFVLLIIGLVMRLRIEESTEFTKVAERGETARLPIAHLLRHHWRTVLLGAALCFVAHGVYVITAFLPSYAIAHDGLPATSGTTSLIVGSAVALLVLVTVSAMVDGRDRRRFTLIGGLLLALWVAPAYLLTTALGTPGLIIAVAVGYSVIMGHYAALSSLLADLFPTEVRYTGVSLSYQVSSVVGGGLMPMALSAAVAAAAGTWWPAAVFGVVVGVVTVVASLIAKPLPTTGHAHHRPANAEPEQATHSTP